MTGTPSSSLPGENVQRDPLGDLSRALFGGRWAYVVSAEPVPPVETIRQLKAANTTILLVEQNARLALDVADRAYVLESGRVTLSGSAAELQHNPDVEHTYLGT